jgi:pimeloyl-ACP methyl ester carboxylesterase
MRLSVCLGRSKRLSKGRIYWSRTNKGAMRNWLLGKIFYPSRLVEPWVGMNYDEFKVPLGDEILDARLVRSAENDPLVIFCHGNGGSLSNYRGMVEFCRNLHLNVVIFDYRGYGLSTDRQPTPDTILDDGLAVYDHLRRYYPEKEIFMWGLSLGGAVAAHVAAQRPDCSGLLLLNTFSSLEEMASSMFPALPPLLIVTFIRSMVNPLLTRQRMKELSCPCLILHSGEDELIPYSMAETNHQSASSSLCRLRMVGGGHNNPIFNDEDLGTIQEFLNGEWNQQVTFV